MVKSNDSATTPATGEAPASGPACRVKGRRLGRLWLSIPLLLAAAALALVTFRVPSLLGLGGKVAEAPKEGGEAELGAEGAAGTASLNAEGRLELNPGSFETLGLGVSTVEPQTRPMTLELFGGVTEYDGNTRARIRPLFKGRVDRVHTEVGRTVHQGDPLVDLYSTELAEAKNSYEIEYIQWVYDRNLVKVREDLLNDKAVSEQLVRETQNNEMKSKREAEVARDKLLVYGLTEEEIDAVKNEVVAQKARMTLRRLPTES